MLTAARVQMRNGMIDPPNPELSKEDQIKHLEDIALFLRRNVVQGVKTPQDEARYHLNIHKDTELGDNEDTKIPKRNTLTGGKTSPVGGCCGGGA